jgi:hypothetical protein
MEAATAADDTAAGAFSAVLLVLVTGAAILD